jgi:hypothetical protein
MEREKDALIKNIEAPTELNMMNFESYLGFQIQRWIKWC